MTRGFVRRSLAALEDPSLRRAVRFATDRLRSSKARAQAEFGDWEALRRRGEEIRSRTMRNLGRYLDEFAEKVRQAGGQVHFAADAEAAASIVRGLARRYGVKLAVKSKSMLSEEIRLNEALAADGVEAVETDLGEYIVQMAGETPSHIIVPALHKDRRSIAALFSRIAGEPVPDDTPSLTAFARGRLRELFLQAGMGITGCNFGVAETGSVVIVTNEGNGRMVTTLPRVQVTLMGMERVVPTLEDLDALLELLPRAATGQATTSYVNIMTGPRRPGEGDGPEALHVVIVDNGRSGLLGGKYEAALHCIRCGACMNVCPVYRQVGGHAYGWIVGGPIGSVITPLFEGMEGFGDLPQASSLCGACYEACPVRIPLHDLLIQLRADDAPKGPSLKGESAAFRLWRWLMASPRRYRLALRLGRLAQAPVKRGGRLRWGPPPLNRWLAGRELPALPRRTFREMWPELEKEAPADD